MLDARLLGVVADIWTTTVWSAAFPLSLDCSLACHTCAHTTIYFLWNFVLAFLAPSRCKLSIFEFSLLSTSRQMQRGADYENTVTRKRHWQFCVQLVFMLSTCEHHNYKAFNQHKGQHVGTWVRVVATKVTNVGTRDDRGGDRSVPWVVALHKHLSWPWVMYCKLVV